MRSTYPKRRRKLEAKPEPLHHADMPPHGAVISRIVIELHGQRVEAIICQAGIRCRTHGVSINGGPMPH